MPYDIYGGAMASSPDGNGVLLFGGYSYSTGGGYLDSILELKSDGQGWVGSWTILTTKLHYPRRAHVVIPVLMHMDIDTCGLDGIVSSGITYLCSTILSSVSKF